MPAARSSRQHSFSMLSRLIAALTGVLFLSNSLVPAALAAEPSPTITGSPQSLDGQAKTPRLIIVSPAFGGAETGPSVEIRINVSRQEDPSTLKVKLNGHDISGRLHSGSCTGTSCTMQGGVSLQDGAKKGQNLLSAQVSGLANSAGDVQRVTFNYHGAASAAGSANSLQYYEPASVGIKTLNPGGGSPWFEIDTGSAINVNDPVVSFPALPGPNGTKVTTFSVAHPTTQFSVSCSTLLQAVALDRTTPSLQEATACGDSISDVQSSLQSALGRSLSGADLIVLGTTQGKYAPAGLDTSSLGGTDYASPLNARNPQPREYMIIGVPGATAGTAHESYTVQAGPDTPSNDAPFLNGTLMQDPSGNYNYIPSDDRALQVVSNVNSPSITVGGQHYTSPSNGGQGVFWLLVLDRERLQPVNYSSLPEWANCPDGSGGSCGGVFNPRSDGGTALANALTAISPRNLIFLVGQGCPFDSFLQLSPGLKNAVNSLGGVGYSLQNLYPQSHACGYSLVSSNLPPLFLEAGATRSSLGGSVALSASQFSAQGQTGIVHGFLARNKSGLYDIGNRDQGTVVNKSPTGTVDYTFEVTASSQRQDWPLTDTPGHLAAYHDISKQLLTDPSIHETGSYLYDVRYFFTNVSLASQLAGLIDSRLAPNASNPVVQSSYDTATAAEFEAARNEIFMELQNVSSSIGYLTGSGGNGGIRGILNGNSVHILSDAFGVANAIGQDQNNAAAQTVSTNSSNILNLSAGLLSIIAPLAGVIAPEVGVLFGVLSGAFWTGSAAETPLTPSSIPGPESSYDAQLSSIISDASSYTNRALDGFDGSVDNILTDAAKLNTIGTLTSDSDSNWNLSKITSYDAVSTIFSDGVRRSLWLGVLQGLYGIRAKYAFSSSDPARFGSGNTVIGCESIYTQDQSGLVPAASEVSYFSPSFPNALDSFFLANVPDPPQPPSSYDLNDVPASASLSTLLTTNQTVAMNGGSQTGLNIPAMILLTNSTLHIGPPLYYFPDKLCLVTDDGETPDSFTITGPSAGVVGQRVGSYVVTPIKDGQPNTTFRGTAKVTLTGPGNLRSHREISFHGKPETVSFTAAYPEAATYTFKVSYGSLSVTKQITAHPAVVEEQVSSTKVTKGTPVTILAKVTGNGRPITDGTVSFTLDNRTLYSAPVGAEGRARFTTSNLPVARNHISAVYRSPDVYGTVRQAHDTKIVTVAP